MTTLPIELTPAMLSSVAGVLLSLSFNYIPGWRVKYGELPSEKKSLIMLVALLLTTGIIFAFVKWGALIPNEEYNAWSFLWMFFLSVYGNQITYAISPLPTDVKTAKAQRIPIRDGNTDAG